VSALQWRGTDSEKRAVTPDFGELRITWVKFFFCWAVEVTGPEGPDGRRRRVERGYADGVKAAMELAEQMYAEHFGGGR
jgi:hypothetical protein